MSLLALWMVSVLGTVVLLGLVGALVLVRARPPQRPYSPEERAELSRVPMSASQKGAWCGLLVGVATLGTITVILVNTSANAYWENDSLRLTVVGIFIGGLVLHVLVSNLWQIADLWKGEVDEREGAILNRASLVQSPAILIAMAAWLITLCERFRDVGAVPVVYLYLMFGSLILIMMIAQSIGVLIGHWMGSRHG